MAADKKLSPLQLGEGAGACPGVFIGGGQDRMAGPRGDGVLGEEAATPFPTS